MNVMMAEKYEFDQKLFDKVRKMMKEVFTSFIQAYIKDGQRYVNEIKLGCKYKQMDKIAQYAHPLKSASASIGAISVSKIAEDIEKKARQASADSENNNIDWNALHKEVEQAFEYTRQLLEGEAL